MWRMLMCGVMTTCLIVLLTVVNGCGSESYPAYSYSMAPATAEAPSAHMEAAMPEEVWVIERYADDGVMTANARPMLDEESTPTSYEEWAGTGALHAKHSDSGDTAVLPLEHTAVDASIAGTIATVGVIQQFSNPYAEKIEAIYTFPLPENAAINEFIMTIGERRIRGIIREREEAEAIYTQARNQGYRAALMTQERPNVFTQSVANIEPFNHIDIEITYFHTVPYVDGWHEFVFPMVVGPRFNPPGTTDGIGAVARGAHGSSGQSTEIQYLKPGERSGHDISVHVAIDAGVMIEEIESVNHRIDVQRSDGRRANVRLEDESTIANRDFVLRYRVAGDSIKSGLVTHTDSNGGYFTLTVYPPRDLTQLVRAPMEMIFVIDCSGSMSGAPIRQAKDAIRHALGRMRPNDTFQIIRFSDNASQLGRAPLPATPRNVRKARSYLNTLDGGGGTMMIEGIRAALDFPHDEQRLRTVAFLTDGFIGNEREILSAVEDKLGASRIFSFGVGSSPNRHLLSSLAFMGRGAVAYVSLNDRASDVMDAYMDRVSHPAMVDVTIDWAQLNAFDVYPRTMPDVFVGRPVTLTGRFNGDRSGTVLVHGVANGRDLTVEVPLDMQSDGDTHAALPSVWARSRITDCAFENIVRPSSRWDREIQETALSYGLMSAYTAFVAVDSSQRTAGDHGTTVNVAVPVPDGVRYDTTVDG
ncbi:MAG: VIT and VWA domain-containing protein [Planctomycetota bacterium]